ncbi:hypothetical protein [Nocardioides sp. KR10-350]|uniref:hypothetical protein n=1 Tax=Nocardioides cheoyonin TaxID=3156615 RepID=UPI0032B566D1
MKIPIVLSSVLVHIEADGALSVELDGEPYAADRDLGRADLGALLDEITTGLDTAVRVEIHEADGTTYADLATPPKRPAPAADEPSPIARPHALAGAGFAPGEEVALAYVVTRQPADSDGHAAMNLPPALLAATRGGLVMLGLTSQRVAPVEAPA